MLSKAGMAVPFVVASRLGARTKGVLQLLCQFLKNYMKSVYYNKPTFA
jgi:hypothetical protein